MKGLDILTARFEYLMLRSRVAGMCSWVSGGVIKGVYIAFQRAVLGLKSLFLLHLSLIRSRVFSAMACTSYPLSIPRKWSTETPMDALHVLLDQSDVGWRGSELRSDFTCEF
jgi:hypothetical protein